MTIWNEILTRKGYKQYGLKNIKYGRERVSKNIRYGPERGMQFEIKYWLERVINKYQIWQLYIEYGLERVRKILNMDEKGLNKILNMDHKGLDNLNEILIRKGYKWY